MTHSRIRKVTKSTGIISTIVGTGSTAYNGDGFQATAANLNEPHGVYLDVSGNVLYIAETYNHRIRKVTLSTGIISTIAGTGTSSFSGDDGQATAASLYCPQGVSLDALGTYLFTYILFYSYYCDLPR